MVYFTDDAFNRRFKSDDDDKTYMLYKMEIYDIFDNNTSFTITLLEEAENMEEAEFMTATYYPMIESVEQALKEQGLVEIS